jgi:hypothetical protein
VFASGGSGGRRRTALAGLLIVAAACGAPRVALPTGAGTPFPEFAQAYAEATAECAAVHTLSASLSLSGRAGAAKLGARIDAGFAEPARLRLEGFPRIHFGGKPFFVLVARDADATLLLTAREPQVLRAPPPAIIEALAGVALDPAELRAVVAGCALGAVQPSGGRAFDTGWAAVDAPAATVFLRKIGARWRVAGARRGALTIEYAGLTSAGSSTVRLRTAPGAGVVPADLTLRLSQVEINPPLDDAVFEVQVPPGAVRITLDELRRAGPLGGGE